MSVMVQPVETPPVATEYERGKLYVLRIDSLNPDPEQPRKYFDEAALKELADSIGKHGILQPILFRKDQSGQLFIVAGERRYEAAKRAGITSLPAIFTEGDPSEISLVENVIRENLTAVEEAEALQQIIEKHGYSQDDLAGVIGKDRTTVSKTLSINRLPLELRDECRGKPECPKNILIEIAKKETPKEMKRFFDKCKREGLLGDAVEAKPKKTGLTKEKADLAITCSLRLKKVLSEVKKDLLSAGKRNSLSDELNSLKTSIDEFLMNLVT